MDSIQALTERVINFRNQRDWAQFHNPKDMAISLSLEAAEVLEHFQWKTQDEVESYLKEHKPGVAEEVMDVLYWVLLMAHDLKIDVAKEFEAKMINNERKYPVAKAKGNYKKHTEHAEEA